MFYDVDSFKDPVQWLYSRSSTHTWWICADVSWVSQCEGKTRDTLHDFSNPIRSMHVTLCDMDLINLATTCV